MDCRLAGIVPVVRTCAIGWFLVTSVAAREPHAAAPPTHGEKTHDSSSAEGRTHAPAHASGHGDDAAAETTHAPQHDAASADGIENEVTAEFQEMTIEQLQKSIEKLHPAAYYTLASRLFAADKKDEAVFWFYLGQLRYRYHLAVHADLDPTGDPALFASLSEVVGAPINQYAFGNVTKLTETIDRVLVWDLKHANTFCAKDDQVYPTIRKGLEEFREYIREHEVMIQVERKKNGLE